MTREILMAAAMLWATSAAATDSGHCDSKPFTLKKPVAAAPTAAPAPVASPAPKPAPPPRPAKSASSKKKYVLGCKQPKG
ncbi:hypothetical protein [Sphingomonas sp. URHD0057]|uniref:hypothetical protein n=1 Tax=Sphingomonas sp. URHD0057 TaxID=1380389 RepID=UPI00048FB6C8|nr:hypothetical protein [Sphingomonas sp. URHD0057]